MPGRRDIDLVGWQFTRWTVIKKGTKRGCWLCQCVCGTQREVHASNLKYGYSKSCGCLPRGWQKNLPQSLSILPYARLPFQPLKESVEKATLAAFEASLSADKPLSDCYLAGVRIIQSFYPTCTRQYAGQRASEIILKSRIKKLGLW